MVMLRWRRITFQEYSIAVVISIVLVDARDVIRRDDDSRPRQQYMSRAKGDMELPEEPTPRMATGSLLSMEEPAAPTPPMATGALLSSDDTTRQHYPQIPRMATGALLSSDDTARQRSDPVYASHEAETVKEVKITWLCAALAFLASIILALVSQTLWRPKALAFLDKSRANGFGIYGYVDATAAADCSFLQDVNGDDEGFFQHWERRCGLSVVAGDSTIYYQHMHKCCSEVLDVYKGVLVIFMTWCHVIMTFTPGSTQSDTLAHFVCNVGASNCFLGFMLCYGFSCDAAYISEDNARAPEQRRARVVRSALLPVFGAWVCSFAWGFMCFELPMDSTTLLQMLDLYIVVGNGGDMLLSFTICLLIAYSMRNVINNGLCSSRPLWTRVSAASILIFTPCAFALFSVRDCTGMKKYLNYFLECSMREGWSSNLPALPHLPYFFLGLVISRAVREAMATMANGQRVATLRGSAISWFLTAAILAIISYPVYTVWAFNFGNIMVQTKWGAINRGFSDGPSLLWLAGNLFTVFMTLSSCAATYLIIEWRASCLSSWSGWLLQLPLKWLEHLGANVLLYLVCADIFLAGGYRGSRGQMPLDIAGSVVATTLIFGATRFIHYLGSSSRA